MDAINEFIHANSSNMTEVFTPAAKVAQASIVTEIISSAAKSDQGQQLKDVNNNNISINNSAQLSLAPKFKYGQNFPSQDLQEIRRLIAIERSTQKQDEYDFWTSDFERMMIDDWLVTRFLLRGSKKARTSGKRYETTMELIRSCAHFRRYYQISALTREREFPVDWLKQNGLFHYGHDLSLNPVIYLRIKLHKPKLIETDELRHEFKRLLLFTLEKCDQSLTNKPGRGICCLFDMTDVTFENVDLELMTWMMKSFKNCGPKLLSYVMIYNLPWLFAATFRFLCNTLMSSSNKQTLKFVYGSDILKYIGKDQLASYLCV